MGTDVSVKDLRPVVGNPGMHPHHTAHEPVADGVLDGGLCRQHLLLILHGIVLIDDMIAFRVNGYLIAVVPVCRSTGKHLHLLVLARSDGYRIV